MGPTEWFSQGPTVTWLEGRGAAECGDNLLRGPLTRVSPRGRLAARASEPTRGLAEGGARLGSKSAGNKGVDGQWNLLFFRNRTLFGIFPGRPAARPARPTPRPPARPAPPPAQAQCSRYCPPLRPSAPMTPGGPKPCHTAIVWSVWEVLRWHWCPFDDKRRMRACLYQTFDITRRT